MMKSMVSFVAFITLISGLLGFVSSLKHLLSMLVSLEFLVLASYMALMCGCGAEFMFISFIFLILSVCEGALGLTILVLMTRLFGGDYFNSFSLGY